MRGKVKSSREWYLLWTDLLLCDVHTAYSDTRRRVAVLSTASLCEVRKISSERSVNTLVRMHFMRASEGGGGTERLEVSPVVLSDEKLQAIVNKRPRETIVLVHGTFANPERHPGSTLWYMRESWFCRQVDALISSSDSSARCWRHLSSGGRVFTWEGDNTWHARARASERLRAHLLDLYNSNYVVHVVGHSHGGNIIRDAVTDAQGELQHWFHGHIIMLGTPVVGLSSRYQKTERRKAGFVALLALVLWVAFFGYVASRHKGPLALDPASWHTAAILFSVGALGWAFANGVWALLASMGVPNAIIRGLGRLVRSSSDAFTSISVRLRGGVAPLLILFSSVFGKAIKLFSKPTVEQTSPERILLINTPLDEAYRLLKGVLENPNPLQKPSEVAGKTRWARFKSSFGAAVELVNSIRKVSVQAAIIVSRRYLTEPQWASLPRAMAFVLLSLLLTAAAYFGLELEQLRPYHSDMVTVLLSWFAFLAFLAMSGVSSAAVAILLPLVAAIGTSAFITRFFSGLVSSALEVPLRHQAWSTIQNFLFGFAGSPWRVSELDVGLSLVGPLKKYARFQEPLEEAIRNRVAEQRKQIGVFHDRIFDQPTEAMLEEIFRRSAAETGEVPLVHGMYYADPDCVGWCADWIKRPLAGRWLYGKKLRESALGITLWVGER